MKFLIKNIVLSRKILAPTESGRGEYLYGSCSNPSDLIAIRRIQADLRNGRDFDFSRHVLFSLRGDRLIYVVRAESREIVGYQMFYFGNSSNKGSKIHAAFTGIRAEFRGNRLATNLREYALENLKLSGIKCVTMDILPENTASRISAAHAGYFEVGRSSFGKSLRLLKRF